MQCSNLLQFDLVTLLVNFSCELNPIMIIIIIILAIFELGVISGHYESYSTIFDLAPTLAVFLDLQNILHFDLHPSMTAGQGHKILQFCEFRCLTGSSLCSLLLQKYSTEFSNADTYVPIYRGNVDLQRILHVDLHPSMTAIYWGHIRSRRRPT